MFVVTPCLIILQQYLDLVLSRASLLTWLLMMAIQKWQWRLCLALLILSSTLVFKFVTPSTSSSPAVFVTPAYRFLVINQTNSMDLEQVSRNC